MSEKCWVLFNVPSGGDKCAWVDEDILQTSFDHGPDRITVEYLTALEPSQKGIGLRKICETAVVNFACIPIVLKAPDVMTSDLSKLWDRIITPPKTIQRGGILPHD